MNAEIRNSEIRAELLRQKRHLEARLQKISTGHLGDKGPVNPDFEEQATENANNEVYDGLESGGHEQLQAINEALARMESGDYGTCVECGKRIPDDRLKAVPSAIRCVACESAQR